jgi:hypothetical protein
MKRNMMGEARIQPGDDLFAIWMDEFGPEDPDQVRITARDLSHEDPFAWTCSLSDDEGNESECHDFETEADLRDFLTQQGVEIEA